MKSIYLQKNDFLASWASPRACLSPLTSRWSTSGCSSPWPSPSLRWSFILPTSTRIKQNRTLSLKQEWMWWRSSPGKKMRWQRRTTPWRSPYQWWWATSCCPSAPLSSPSSSGLSGSSSLTLLVMLRVQICQTVLQLILLESHVIFRYNSNILWSVCILCD